MAGTYICRGNDGLNVCRSTLLDLSGSAISNEVVLHFTRAATLKRINLVYPEASSADAGVAIKVGKESDDDYYYTGTSEVSKAAWYETNVTMLKTDIQAGDTLVVSMAGSKVGTGTVIVTLEYRFTE